MDSNLDLKDCSHLDLDFCKRFVHTPKPGDMAPENEELLIQYYTENKFIQDYMHHVDDVQKKWVQEQSPKIAKKFTNEFSKYMIESSPFRSARQTYHERKREEKRLRDQGIIDPATTMTSSYTHEGTM